MAFPSGKAQSSLPIATPYLPPDGQPRELLVDYEYGASTLGNASGGLQSVVWRVWLDGDNIRLAPNDNLASATTLLSAPDVTELSLSFDQNMMPIVAFVQSGNTKLYWQDLTIPGYVTTNLGTTASSPFLTFDDKRPYFIGSADVMFFYLRGTKVYVRLLRDRFLQEYEWGSIPPGSNRIVSAGMSVGGRVQLQFDSLEVNPPVLTSNNGLSIVNVTVVHGTTYIGEVSAVDTSNPVRPLTYTLQGNDVAPVQMSPAHELTFRNPADYINPVDADGNNVYDFMVVVSNGVYSVAQIFVVTVIPEMTVSQPIIIEKPRVPVFRDGNTDYTQNLHEVLVFDEVAVQNKLFNFLRCRKGERFRLPEFGCGLHEFIHEMCTDATAALIRMDLLQGLQTWVPEIQLVVGNSYVVPRETRDGYYIYLEYIVPALNNKGSVSFDVSKY